jgi:hypothetical protein
MSRTRPLAFVINNIRISLPQLGVSRADIIYEVLVEGGITRMLVLYQDITDAGIIGSIRSARHYYVDIAQGYDAVFFFAGGSPQAYSALSSRNITRLDGVHGRYSNIYYRDQHRRSTMGLAHSMVSSSDLILEWLPRYDLRLEHEEGYERHLTFVDDGTPVGGNQALEVVVRFSSGKTTSFHYNEEEKLYYVRQYNMDYIDGNDNSRPSFTNILVLKTSVSSIPGDDAGRQNVTTVGSGEGYFVCGGKYTPINWSRADLSSQFIYTLADGSELELGRGKTYICIVPTNRETVFS